MSTQTFNWRQWNFAMAVSVLFMLSGVVLQWLDGVGFSLAVTGLCLFGLCLVQGTAQRRKENASAKSRDRSGLTLTHANRIKGMVNAND